MKKLLSVLLILVTLLSVAAPAAAVESHTSTMSFSVSATEEEFREYAEETGVFSLGETVALNSSEIHEKGYFYTNLLNHTDATMLCAYEVTDMGFVWRYSDATQSYVWASDYYINLDPMLGLVYGSAEYNSRLSYYVEKLYAGVWACRYDNPAEFDKYTNTITLELTPTPNEYGVITDFDVYVILYVSDYYQDSLATAHDQEVAQVVAEANKKGSQYEAMLYIHDYLAKTAEYDYSDEALDAKNYSNTEAFFYAHASFGVLNKNLGVCESYAKAFKIICDRLDNPPVCSVFVSSNHMWNLVLLDGKWYCVDVTWDDLGGNLIQHVYFLCRDPDVVDGAEESHIPVTRFDFVPTYATTDYHFHTLSYVVQVNATETTTGTKAHYKCSGCSKLFTDSQGKNETTLSALSIPKLTHTHSMIYVEAKAATESATGLKAHYKCSSCGKYFTDSQGKNETTLAAVTIAKLPHSLTYVAQVNATESKTGTKAHYKCSGCGKLFTDVNGKTETTLSALTIPKLTHSHTLKAVAQVNATETSTGTKAHYKCSGCGKLFTDSQGKNETTLSALTIPKLTHSHTLKAVAQVNATETATGTKAHYKCSGCGKLFTDANGKNETTLSALTIPKLTHSHTLKAVAQVNATETATGTKAHYKCSGCGKLFTDSQGKNETTLSALTIPKTVVAPSVSAANTASGVKISWTAATNAEKYYVYRRANSSSAWTRIKETTTTEYVDTTVTSGSQYQYMVRAVRGATISAYSNVVTMKFLAASKPAVKNSASGITTSWSKVTGATGYIVYRREKTASGWSGWTKLTTTKSLTYTDKTAKVGTDYQYVAKAYYGSYKAASVASSTVRRLSVSSVKTVANGNTLKTTWSKVAGAADYIVYRSQLSGGKWSSWSAVATVTGTTYTDSNIKSGVTYRYSVCARYSSSKSVGTISNSVMYLSEPKVTATAGTSSIVAKWAKVTGATGYTVYRRQKTAAGWSGWTNLGNTTSLSYTDKKATKGVQYQYTARAYNGSMRSTYTASAAVCILATPKVTNANKAEGIQVSWNKIAGAESYIVYRGEWTGSKWTNWAVITTTTGTSVLDKTVTSGTIYRYCARAVAGACKSGYTASASFRYLSTPAVSAALGNNQINVSWKKITGATGYIVYRRQKTSSGWSSWTNLGKTTSLTYADKKITVGGQYQYTVKAYCGSMVSATKASATVNTFATPVVTVKNSADGVVAQWGKVANATQYIVYRRELSGDTWGSWTRLTTTTATVYADTTCEGGKTYQYTARAVKGSLLSSYKASASIVFLETPVIRASEMYGGYVEWDAVEGATEYWIYRRIWVGDTPTAWERVRENKGPDPFCHYVESTGMSGYDHEYKVYAVNGTSKSVGSESKKVNYFAAPEIVVTQVSGGVQIQYGPVGGATGYTIYKRDVEASNKFEILYTGTDSSYLDTNVVAGKTYRYYVIAHRGNQDSELSNRPEITIS